MYQLVDNKSDRRKERITRRAEWNEGPWEKSFGEENEDYGKWCDEDFRRDIGG